MEKVDILLEYLLDRFLKPCAESYVTYSWNRVTERILKETEHYDFNTFRYIKKSGEIYCGPRTTISDSIYGTQATIMSQYPETVSINTHYILILILSFLRATRWKKVAATVQYTILGK